jgi:hypothetical protein
MKRLPENVTSKFAELFAALHMATDDLKLAGAEANLIGDFSRVETLNDSCRRLQALESDIRFTMDNFGSNFKARTDSNNRPHKGHRHHTRKAGARLRVKVGEQVIEETTIAETFAKALRVIGLERVAKLNKVLASIPLISKTPTNGYQTQKSCDGWYITTHVNLQNARTLLEEIGKALNVPIKVEFVER